MLFMFISGTNIERSDSEKTGNRPTGRTLEFDEHHLVDFPGLGGRAHNFRHTHGPIYIYDIVG